MKRLDPTANGDTKFRICTNLRETAALNTERLVGKGFKAAFFKGLLIRGNVNTPLKRFPKISKTSGQTDLSNVSVAEKRQPPDRSHFLFSG